MNMFYPPHYVIDARNNYDFIDGNFPEVEKPYDKLRYSSKVWVWSQNFEGFSDFSQTQVKDETDLLLNTYSEGLTTAYLPLRQIFPDEALAFCLKHFRIDDTLIDFPSKFGTKVWKFRISYDTVDNLW